MKTIPNELFFSHLEEIISEGKQVELRVKGKSMRPFLSDEKSIVVLAPYLPEELVPGAVILFRFRGKYLLHRIIRRDGVHLTIQGDGIVRSRENASVEDVVALVRKIITPGGRLIDCNSLGWRFRSKVWMYLRPFRRPLLAAYYHLFHK